MLALLLACSFSEPETSPAVEPVEAAITAATWDAWPADNGLIPTAAGLAEELGSSGLAPRVADLGSRISHDTDIVLASLASMRTGAEIGVLLLEASAAAPDVRSARLARIGDGFEVLDLDTGPLERLRADSKEPVEGGWPARIDTDRVLLASLAGQRGDGVLPLALAGGWLQALWLVARAAELEQSPDVAHALLHRPEVDAYFEAYLAHCAGERFPDATIDALDEGMTTIRDLASNDPMSADDVRRVRETAEGLLGMM